MLPMLTGGHDVATLQLAMEKQPKEFSLRLDFERFQANKELEL